ncbi:MAG: hypothetical protein HY054_12445 [Proteobacteria bacterium]|nr:hypothetical protein [Pseudomonadota bacterium]
MRRLDLLRAASKAEKAWMIAVEAEFGERDAGLARFQERAKGEEGSELRKLHDRYQRAYAAYKST